MSFQSEPSSSETICAMVEAMCWPMSALPQVTVTIPSGAIEYQTLGSKLAGAASAWSAPTKPGTAVDDILDDLHVRIHVALRSVEVDAVRISEAARMIAFWMRE